MRFASLHTFLVGLAGLSLSACSANQVIAIASLPRVCPSAVRADLKAGAITFYPVVENRGVNDATTPFRVYMRVAIGTNGGTRNLVWAGPTAPMIGTHAAPGVSAGPPVELTTTILTLASRTFAYDPQQTYTVTLVIWSADDTFNTANQDCQWFGPVSFKGGELL